MFSNLVGGFFALILGAVLGSFANVLVIRMKEESSMLGRSRCVNCKVLIKARHLVPILSWIILRGRCANCHKSIHFQYPIVEVMSALLALIAVLRHNPLLVPSETSYFLFELLFALDLIILVTFDLRWQLLPIEFMIGSGIFFGIWNLLFGLSVWSLLVGIIVCAGFLYAQVFISKGKWMGSGDPWFGGLVGVALGWPAAGFALYLAYIVGGALAVFLLTSGKVRNSTRLPFAPLLAVGAMLGIWFTPYLSEMLSRALERPV